MLAQLVLIAIIFVLILILCFKKSPRSDDDDGDAAEPARRAASEMTAGRSIRTDENSLEKRKKMVSANMFHRTLEDGDSIREIQSILAAARDVRTSAGDDDDRPNPSAPPAADDDIEICFAKQGKVDKDGIRAEGTPVDSISHSMRSVPECTVCLEGYYPGQSISWSGIDCDHIYHTACLMEWLTLHNDCPLCRVTIIGNSLALPINDDHRLAIRTGSADRG